MKDLEHFFQDDTHNDGLLVLDDCPNESILYARSERANHGSNIRLVYAHHDYFEKKNFPDTIMVEFTSGEMREEVEERTMINAIKNIMDGLKYTAQQAMELLKIPADDQPKYLAKL